jgi:dipeptidase E
MTLLIVSTSTVHGKPYLSYLDEEVPDFFASGKNILFVPYARPGGISWDEYTETATRKFMEWGYTMNGIHTFAGHEEALNWADGVFVGGGNTFLLLKTIYETGLFPLLDKAVRNGLPYMGTSAGCNLTGLTVGTTNDMPIVYPPSFKAFGWVPFNINPPLFRPPTPPANTWAKHAKHVSKSFIILMSSRWLVCAKAVGYALKMARWN